MKTKKEFLKQVDNPEFVKKVLNAGGLSWSEIKEMGWDAYSAGNGAVPGMIYHKDTVKFGKKHHLEILKQLDDFKNECGKLESKPSPTDETQYFNWLTWFAWENTMSKVLNFWNFKMIFYKDNYKFEMTQFGNFYRLNMSLSGEDVNSDMFPIGFNLKNAIDKLIIQRKALLGLVKKVEKASRENLTDEELLDFSSEIEKEILLAKSELLEKINNAKNMAMQNLSGGKNENPELFERIISLENKNDIVKIGTSIKKLLIFKDKNKVTMTNYSSEHKGEKFVLDTEFKTEVRNWCIKNKGEIYKKLTPAYRKKLNGYIDITIKNI